MSVTDPSINIPKSIRGQGIAPHGQGICRQNMETWRRRRGGERNSVQLHDACKRRQGRESLVPLGGLLGCSLRAWVGCGWAVQAK